MSSRCASTLVYVDHDGKALLPASLKAVQAASKVGGDVSVLVAGGSDEVGVEEKAKKNGGKKRKKVMTRR